MYTRVIPRLDIKGPNLVKGINFEGLRVLGKPESFARHYYENGADELVFQDAVASLYGRNSLLDIVEKTSREIFIPLCVGGGLRSVDDIRSVLRAGADKVAINTAAVQRPELVREASRTFGASTIVVSIEAIRQPDGSYEAFVDYGREATAKDAVEWAEEAVRLGAGELMVTAVDCEGTGQGYDLDLTARIATRVSVPVIACGGCGRTDHAVEAAREGHADAVGMASILHYGVIAERHFEYDAETFAAEGNVEFLGSARNHSRFQPSRIQDIKTALAAAAILCRQQEKNG